MSYSFLQSVQSVMQRRFSSNPILRQNVITVDISDTQFLVVSAVNVPDPKRGDDYLLTHVGFDRNGYEVCKAIIYAQDNEGRQAILDYVSVIGDTKVA